MEVLRPKELDTHPGDEAAAWARDQLSIARSILDNPGGGLLFATQTTAHARSGLYARDAARWRAVPSGFHTASVPPIPPHLPTAPRRREEAPAGSTSRR